MNQFSITQRASIAVVTLITCTISLYTAEPKDMLLKLDAKEFCVKRSLECDPHMRPYMVDVKSSKKHSATLSMFNNLLKVDDLSQCVKILTDEKQPQSEASQESKLAHLQDQFQHAGFMFYCIDALFKEMTEILGRHWFLESAAVGQQIINSKISFDPTKLSTRGMQIYYTNRAIIKPLEQGDSREDWQKFWDACKEIMQSHDKELLKLMLKPTAEKAHEIAQMKDGYDWNDILESWSESNFEQLIEQNLENTIARESTAQKKLLYDLFEYHQAITRAGKSDFNRDNLTENLKRTLARFVTYHTQYDQLRTAYYQQIVESFDAIKSMIQKDHTLLRCVNFGELCQNHLSLQESFTGRELFPADVHEWLSRTAATAYASREALVMIRSKKQLAPEPRAQATQSGEGSSANRSYKSHKSAYKSKKKKPATATLESIIDSFKDMGLTGTPTAEPKALVDQKAKVKIASDGSYTRLCDITDHHITIHSIDDALQVELWKKIDTTETPSNKIVYTPYVIDWLTKPKDVIKTKRKTVDAEYAVGKEQNTIDIHAFPRLVDQYVHSLGSPSTVASRRDDEQVSAYWIPGTMTRNTITSAGLFVYLFNNDNVCFHRMFDKRTNGQIMQDITAKNALDQYQVPQN